MLHKFQFSVNDKVLGGTEQDSFLGRMELTSLKDFESHMKRLGIEFETHKSRKNNNTFYNFELAGHQISVIASPF